MATVSMKEAQARLPELIRGLAAGEELVITDGDQPVAKLVVEPGKASARAAGYDFSDLVGTVRWKGDALAEQRRLRGEW